MTEDCDPNDHTGAAPVPDLRRPALLVRAARIGLGGYRRARDLGRILGAPAPEQPGRALPALGALERDLELRRRTGVGGYLPSAHVAVLTALMAEARAAADPGAGIT